MRDPAAELKADLDGDLPVLMPQIPMFATERSATTGRSTGWHEEQLRLAFADLGMMLAQVTNGDAIWIVQD